MRRKLTTGKESNGNAPSIFHSRILQWSINCGVDQDQYISEDLQIIGPPTLLVGSSVCGGGSRIRHEGPRGKGKGLGHMMQGGQVAKISRIW